jgi:4-amino-4-deoxy-L-arabinose transferase-like glycosyltransferase
MAWSAFAVAQLASRLVWAPAAQLWRRCSSLSIRSFSMVWIALIALLLFGRLAHFPLQDPDEGRYAEIPREMIELRDWVTPHLNYVKYFEKPPLLYWLVGSSFLVFGPSEGAARLVPALAAGITLAATYAIGRRRLGTRSAWIAVAVAATSPLFFVFSQGLATDMLLTACVTTAAAALIEAQERPSGGPWLFVAALSLALGVLTKGPVAIVLVALPALAFAATGTRPAWRASALVAPLAVFLVVTVPWFALVMRRNPEFFDLFFVRENLVRFLSDEVGHPAGPFYYVPVILGGLTPWAIAPFVLASYPTGRRFLRSLQRCAETRAFELWACSVALFFSIARSKLSGYVLPAVPPLSLLLGGCIDQACLDAEVSESLLVGLTGMWVALGLAVLVVGAFGTYATEWSAAALDIDARLIPDLSLTCAASGAILVSTGVLSVWIGDREWNEGVAYRLAAVLAVGLGAALLAAIPVRSAVKTSKVLADGVELEHAAAAGPCVLVSYRSFMQGLGFYTRSRVVLVDTSDEIAPGASTAADREAFFWEGTDALRSLWSSGRPVCIATRGRFLSELVPALAPRPRLLAADGERVLLGNTRGPTRYPGPGTTQPW